MIYFPQAHWRLTAILEVLERFESHEEAVSWYELRDLPLPSNCMVDGSEPLDLDKTVARCKIDGKKGRPSSAGEWDDQYWERARENPVFLVCKPLFRELHRPPVITERNAAEVFGPAGMPNTFNPPAISRSELDKLARLCLVRL